MAKSAVDVENVFMSFAPTQFRGQRLLPGTLEPPIRISFTDGMTYDLMLDHAGPRGLLPRRRSYLRDFITDIQVALGYPGDASK